MFAMVSLAGRFALLLLAIDCISTLTTSIGYRTRVSFVTSAEDG